MGISIQVKDMNNVYQLNMLMSQMRNDLDMASGLHSNQAIDEWIKENTDEQDRLINLGHEMVGISMRDTERNILNIFKTLFDEYTCQTNEHY